MLVALLLFSLNAVASDGSLIKCGDCGDCDCAPLAKQVGFLQYGVLDKLDDVKRTCSGHADDDDDDKSIEEQIEEQLHERQRFRYVRAGGCSEGDGTKHEPWNTLAVAQQYSSSWTTLIVLPSTLPLAGGIRLERNQNVVGATDPTSNSFGAQCTLTNSKSSYEELVLPGAADNYGAAIIVAPNSRSLVKNLQLRETWGPAVWYNNTIDMKFENLRVERYNRGRIFANVPDDPVSGVTSDPAFHYTSLAALTGVHTRVSGSTSLHNVRISTGFNGGGVLDITVGGGASPTKRSVDARHTEMFDMTGELLPPFQGTFQVSTFISGFFLFCIEATLNVDVADSYFHDFDDYFEVPFFPDDRNATTYAQASAAVNMVSFGQSTLNYRVAHSVFANFREGDQFLFPVFIISDYSDSLRVTRANPTLPRGRVNGLVEYNTFVQDELVQSASPVYGEFHHTESTAGTYESRYNTYQNIDWCGGGVPMSDSVIAVKAHDNNGVVRNGLYYDITGQHWPSETPSTESSLEFYRNAFDTGGVGIGIGVSYFLEQFHPPNIDVPYESFNANLHNNCLTAFARPTLESALSAPSWGINIGLTSPMPTAPFGGNPTNDTSVMLVKERRNNFIGFNFAYSDAAFRGVPDLEQVAIGVRSSYSIANNYWGPSGRPQAVFESIRPPVGIVPGVATFGAEATTPFACPRVSQCVPSPVGVSGSAVQAEFASLMKGVTMDNVRAKIRV